MADEYGERTEAPTPRRLEEARTEGRIARSNDLSAAVGILAGLLLLNALGGSLIDGMLTLTRTLSDAADPTLSELPRELLQAFWLAISGVGPFLALLFLASVAGLAVQSGIVLAWKRLNPDLQRIDPLRGFQRLASPEAAARLAFGLLKVGLIAAIAYFTLPGQLGRILSLGELAAPAGWSLATEIVFRFGLNLSLLLLVLGLADYLFQRFRLMQSLRMTKQEVREELKRMEGDPMIKQRRRQIAAKLAMQRIAQEVPRADVIITNPTEYAVALRYDDCAMAAPRLVAKGTDYLALRIRQIAQQHGVPIVQRPPLARALYAAVEVGGEVPAGYYKAVAEVLAYVYQLSKKAPVPAER